MSERRAEFSCFIATMGSLIICLEKPTTKVVVLEIFSLCLPLVLNFSAQAGLGGCSQVVFLDGLSSNFSAETPARAANNSSTIR